jgi:hypothetical protein
MKQINWQQNMNESIEVSHSFRLVCDWLSLLLPMLFSSDNSSLMCEPFIKGRKLHGILQTLQASPGVVT